MKTAIYAGSFDIFTVGHKFIADEALSVFDKLYIAIGTNPGKKSLFSLEDKIQMIKNSYPDNSKVEVVSFENQFLVNFCRNNDIGFVVRGLRNVEDLEYEKQINFMNNKINSKVKTIYFIPPTELSNVSSSLVKSLIGLPEWQFIVPDMLASKANMPFMTELAYPSKKVKDILKSMVYYVSGGKIDDETLNKIIYNYNSPERYYHTMQHINEMFSLLEDWEKDNHFHSTYIPLAILFHDAIYNPFSKTNEEDSVKLFDESVYMDSKAKQEIKDLIMITKTHQSNGYHVQDLMIDLDLAILGSNSIRFDEYERQIRAEYKSVSDQVYNAGRIEFIRGIMDRPKIFLDDYFYKKYEENARTNLKNLLKSLGEING